MSSNRNGRGSAARPLPQQTVVITGASSGIGRATARHLAARGAAVVLTSRRVDALEMLAWDLNAAGGRAIAVPGDVTSEADLRAVARAAVVHFGEIDTWINNAAVYIQGGVADTTLEEYRRVLEVNLLGYIAGTRCALEVMREQGHGGIIQVSSIVAKRGAGYQSAYTASKAGLDGFTESLRTELWGSGIRVSTVYLPPVDTPVYRHARAKLGTIPKPPPPVADPALVARAIGRLAERPREELVLGGFGKVYRLLAWVPPRAGDWFLHHTVRFAMSDIPAGGDNLDGPLDDPPRERDGWSRRGWRGLTVRDAVRALPVESAVAAALGVVAAGAFVRRMRG